MPGSYNYTEPLDFESRYSATASEAGQTEDSRGTKAYFHPIPGLAAGGGSAGHGYAKILDRMGLDARIVATYFIGSEYYKMEQMYVQRQPSTRHADTGTWIMKQAQFGISNRAKAEMQSIRDVYYQQAHDQELKSL